MNIMKLIKNITAAVLTLTLLGAPLAGLAADKKAAPKPYTLKTCPVSGEKLGEMGDAYTFVHGDREIKLCCKDCLKDFNKNPGKYLKVIEKEEAKAKAKK